MKRVRVIDYEAGNLFNVVRAFEHLGCRAELASQADDILAGDFLVLPGVGAFGDGMASLRERELVSPIIDWVNSGRPFIGVCLGMQLLLSESEEFGHHQGLGIIPGLVKKLPAQPGLKVPNIGWHPLRRPGSSSLEGQNDGFLQDISSEQDMYFVHSYAAYPENPDTWLARTQFGNHWFCSALSKDNVFACQFHPEKSGEAGLNILRRFIAI